MKKIKILLLTTLFCAVCALNCFAAETSETESAPTETFRNKNNAEVLLDSISFSISSNGVVRVWDNTDNANTPKLVEPKLEDVVTGTIEYYIKGIDAKQRTKYAVRMSIVSEKNLKKSVLETKAQGTSSWHSNSKNHVGKTGINERVFVYSKNPPANPYCYAKASITISDGTVYKIPQRKYTNPIVVIGLK